jgi:hypothetical protein
MGEQIMRDWQNAIGAAILLGLGAVFHSVAGLQAQTVTVTPNIALKGGETLEVTDLFWAVNCRSILTGTPEAEILSGPPGVTVAVKEAMVLPGGCAQRVKGGKLELTSPKEIVDESLTTLIIRIKYKSRNNGERAPSLRYNLSLIP